MTFTESWLVIAGVVSVVGLYAWGTLKLAEAIANVLDFRAWRRTQLSAPGLRRRKVS